jgi:hypothetical protein
MFYLMQRLGPLPTILFFWSLLGLWGRLTGKSQNPIPIAGFEIVRITIVFTEITLAGAVLWGATNSSKYTWGIHHVCVAIASIASCIFLFFIWRNKQRFELRSAAKRNPDTITSKIILLLIVTTLFDLGFSASFPTPVGYNPHLPITSVFLVSAIGNLDSSIGVLSLLCLFDVFIILGFFYVILEEKTKRDKDLR